MKNLLFQKIKNFFSSPRPLIETAERIKIDRLQKILTELRNEKTEFDFIGITSNGIDCIYFVLENSKFNLEFEAIASEQLPFIDKLKNFAVSNNYKVELTTHNNQPNYKSDKSAPVIRFETNLSLQEMAKLGEKVQSEIFRNNAETIYDVVP